VSLAAMAADDISRFMAAALMPMFKMLQLLLKLMLQQAGFCHICNDW
jgi:hypothetical protein